MGIRVVLLMFACLGFLGVGRFHSGYDLRMISNTDEIAFFTHPIFLVSLEVCALHFLTGVIRTTNQVKEKLSPHGSNTLLGRHCGWISEKQQAVHLISTCGYQTVYLYVGEPCFHK